MQVLWAIPKKYGKAVMRNHIKRVSRAAFFQALKAINRNALLKKHQRLQIAFTPQEEFLKLSFQEKADKIKRMLVQIRSPKETG